MLLIANGTTVLAHVLHTAVYRLAPAGGGVGADRLRRSRRSTKSARNRTLLTE
jgi:hypothetical protein